MFLVLEGIDGCGKSTQLELLKTFFEQQGQEVKQLRDPGTTNAALAIRQILLNPEVEMDPLTQTLLFTAARCETARHAWIHCPGRVFLADRWTMSTLAYQCRMGNVSPEIVVDLHNQFCLNPAVDLYVVIDCPAEVAEQRKSAAHRAYGTAADRFEIKPLAWRQELRQAYLDLGRGGKLPTRALDTPAIVVDGTQEPPLVFSQILQGLVRNCPAFCRLLANNRLDELGHKAS